MAEHSIEAAEHGHDGAEGIEGHVEEEHIHLPGPSPYPFTLSLSLFILMIGLMFFPHWGTDASAGQWLTMLIIAGIGAIGMFWSVIAWGIQISEA
jgi:hypothetical protein